MNGRGRFDWRVVVLVAMVAALLSAPIGASPAAAKSLSWSAPVKVDPPHGHLHSLSCASPSFCVAVDLEGKALTYNGHGWSKPVKIHTAGLSVSCPLRTFCSAVDGYGRALTYRGSWSGPVVIDQTDPELESITGQPIYAGLDVSCASPSFCVAVDNHGRALTYTGGSWSAPRSIATGPGGAVSVSCASPSFCARMEGNDAQVYSGGGSWGGLVEISTNTPRSSELGTFDDVSCPSPSFCVAVGHASAGSARGRGEPGGPAAYNGHSWGGMAFLDWSGPSKGYMAVSCPSRAFCVATDGEGKVLTYNGHSWSKPVKIDPGINAPGEPMPVSCPTASFCVAVDGNGRALYGRVKDSKGKGHKHRSHR